MSRMSVKEVLAAMARNDPHRSPSGYMNLLRLAIEALAREQASAARLLGYIEDAKQTAETWKARAVRAEDLAWEKANAVPQIDGVSAWAERERRLAREVDRAAALRRAEAAERKAGYSVAAEVIALKARDEFEQDASRWKVTAQTYKTERDALRADCEGLSKPHEQDKAELATAKEHLAGMHKVAEQDRATAQTATADLDEMRRERNRLEAKVGDMEADLARWRKAAGELRNLFGADKPMGSPHYYAEDFVRLHLRATLKDAEKP